MITRLCNPNAQVEAVALMDYLASIEGATIAEYVNITDEVTVTRFSNGVYAVVNNRAEFKNVQVLAQGGQFYVVRPLDEGKLALRAGDQIIIRGKNIHHGSIVIE